MRSSPTPSAPSVDRVRRLLGRAQVGENLDSDAVLRCPDLVRVLTRAGAPRLQSIAPSGRVALHVRRRVDLERPRLAVEQERRSVLDPEDGVADPDHRRQPQRPREDRRMRGGGAVRCSDADDARRIESGGIGRRQLAGDHDPLVSD